MYNLILINKIFLIFYWFRIESIFVVIMDYGMQHHCLRKNCYYL